MSDYNERPVWRTVLSVCLVIFAIVRFGYHCSRTNDRSRVSNQNELDLQTFSNPIQPSQHAYSNQTNKGYNELFYLGYNYLDSLNAAQLQRFHVVKLSKDSLVNIDFSTKLRAFKNYFLQNTHDDTLRFAIKTNQSYAIFVHSFETKASLDKSFKTLKAGSRISRLKDFLMLNERSKLVSYTIFKNRISFKGMALLTKNQDYKVFIEFESKTLSQAELETKVLKYISKNIVASKS